MSFFDVKGIKSIHVKSEYFEGELTTRKLVINMKEGYLSKYRDAVGISIEEKYVTQIDIHTGMTLDQLEKLKKAFIHLCKLFGGSPIDDDMF